VTDSVGRIKARILPVLRRHGVVRAALFGSVVRGEAGPTSDVDLVVEFGGERSLLDLVALKLDLEVTLKKRVDVTTFNGLHPTILETVQQEQVKVL
jgi:predicted nucleotidyltransferase